MPNIPWDEYYMRQAFAVADGSKDPSTKVGAVIVTSEDDSVVQRFSEHQKKAIEIMVKANDIKLRKYVRTQNES